jgi:glycosyltransferase involved in cell wall biosynthesis
VIECADDKTINFVIAGSGPILPELNRSLSASRNFVLPGWVSDCQAFVLAKRSTLLLAPYADLDDFSMSLPNKFLDAINHSKPIITSIPGFAAQFISEEQIGIPYSNSIPNSLSKLLGELSTDEKRIKKMSRNAEVLSQHSFNGKTLYDQIVDVLEIMAKN